MSANKGTGLKPTDVRNPSPTDYGVRPVTGHDIAGIPARGDTGVTNAYMIGIPEDYTMSRQPMDNDGTGNSTYATVNRAMNGMVPSSMQPDTIPALDFPHRTGVVEGSSMDGLLIGDPPLLDVVQPNVRQRAAMDAPLGTTIGTLANGPSIDVGHGRPSTASRHRLAGGPLALNENEPTNMLTPPAANPGRNTMKRTGAPVDFLMNEASTSLDGDFEAPKSGGRKAKGKSRMREAASDAPTLPSTTNPLGDKPGVEANPITRPSTTRKGTTSSALDANPITRPGGQRFAASMADRPVNASPYTNPRGNPSSTQKPGAAPAGY